jgi:5-methylcytosine-specific restriction enzyme B
MALSSTAPTLSADALAILRALKSEKLVLVNGAPATGKTHALLEVADLFSHHGQPVSKPSAAVPIPAAGVVPTEAMPSPSRTDRASDTMVMDQGTKLSDVWRALEPQPDAAQSFTVSEGFLWKLNEWSRQSNHTALAVIDELNRGPAVKALGPGITALESDKRSDDNDSPVPGQTFTFPLMTDSGARDPYWVSPHLYVLCAQNNADTSVEPIDAAWLRRFEVIQLYPKLDVLQDHLGVKDLTAELPAGPDNRDAIYAAAIRAWSRVNARIRVGRNRDFEIGHGIFLHGDPPATAAEALAYVRRGWKKVETHVDEIFYDEVDAIADVLRVSAPGHPYKILRETFADIERPVLERGSGIASDETLYKLLRAIAMS